MLGNIPCT